MKICPDTKLAFKRAASQLQSIKRGLGGSQYIVDLVNARNGAARMASLSETLSLLENAHGAVFHAAKKAELDASRPARIEQKNIDAVVDAYPAAEDAMEQVRQLLTAIPKDRRESAWKTFATELYGQVVTLARHSKAMTSQIDKMLPYMCEPVRGLKALSAEDKLMILKALVDNDFNETLVSERCSATPGAVRRIRELYQGKPE